MSNRTMLEINHDAIPDAQWYEDLGAYLRTGDIKALPRGVTFFGMRHHSEPCPLGEPPCGWHNQEGPSPSLAPRGWWVKKLAWQAAIGNGFLATTTLGEYYAGVRVALFRGHPFGTDDGFDDPKAACQAHYEAAMREGLEDCGWRPIADAPKDGRTVILWNGYRNIFGSYDDIVCQWFDEGGPPVRGPLFWQPLPPPPEETR